MINKRKIIDILTRNRKLSPPELQELCPRYNYLLETNQKYVHVLLKESVKTKTRHMEIMRDPIAYIRREIEKYSSLEGRV